MVEFAKILPTALLADADQDLAIYLRILSTDPDESADQVFLKLKIYGISTTKSGYNFQSEINAQKACTIVLHTPIALTLEIRSRVFVHQDFMMFQLTPLIDQGEVVYGVNFS